MGRRKHWSIRKDLLEAQHSPINVSSIYLPGVSFSQLIASQRPILVPRKQLSVSTAALGRHGEGKLGIAQPMNGHRWALGPRCVLAAWPCRVEGRSGTATSTVSSPARWAARSLPRTGLNCSQAGCTTCRGMSRGETRSCPCSDSCNQMKPVPLYCSLGADLRSTSAWQNHFNPLNNISYFQFANPTTFFMYLQNHL